MKSPALQIEKVDAVSVLVAETATATKEQLLHEFAGFGSEIADDFSRDCAVDTIMSAKEFLKQVEADREAIKKPVLDLTRKIDGKAKELTEDIAAKSAVLNRSVTAYALKLEKAREEAERQRQVKLAKQEAERRRIEEQERKLAAARAEAEATVAEPFTPEQAQAAQADLAAIAAAQAAAEAQRAQVEAARTATQQQALTPAPLPKGATLRKRRDYMVQDIHALYKARPEFVELKDKRAVILSAINSGGLAECPGIAIFTSAKTQV